MTDSVPPAPVGVHNAGGPLRAVVTGAGCVRELLVGELLDQGVRRPMVVCGENVAVSTVLTTVRDALGSQREPAVFTGSRPHTPFDAVTAGAAAAREAGADALVAVGGGSTIDLARGIAVLLADGLDDVRDLAPARFGSLGAANQAAGAAGPDARPPMPIACVPTTLSFAEFQPFWGARDPDDARKHPYLERGLVTRTVFLDGEIAASTPSAVWRETGVKAVDDALFTYCSCGEPEPFLDPVLESALRTIVTLLDAPDGPGCARARQDVFNAVWTTKHPLPRLGPRTVPAWFSTAARHSLGGVCELPHGIGSCVALPTGLRFHASTTAPRQAALAPIFDSAAATLDDAVARWLARLGVATTLAAAGFAACDLDAVAGAMADEAPGLGPVAGIRAALSGLG